MVAAENVRLAFDLKGDIMPKPGYNWGQEDLLNDQGQDQEVNACVAVTLEAGREYTYVELLNAIYRAQNGQTWVKDQLLEMANNWLIGISLVLWDQNQSLIIAVPENGALLWPAFREILVSDCTYQPPPGTRSSGNEAACAEIHRRAVLKDIDFWML
jgi:hypothetical protein